MGEVGGEGGRCHTRGGHEQGHGTGVGVAARGWWHWEGHTEGWTHGQGTHGHGDTEGRGCLTAAVAEWIESRQAKNKFYYYHQKFPRVPDLSECVEGDHLCFFEAEAQWRRDR